MTQLTPHFSLSEFTSSSTADALDIDNSLPSDLLRTAIATAAMMERIRAFLSQVAGRDIVININSAYRCLDLNHAVGSKNNGDHPLMKAVDWTAYSFGTPYKICVALAPQIVNLGIGQLIYECPSSNKKWIHTSSRVPDKVFNSIITVNNQGTRLGIRE